MDSEPLVEKWAWSSLGCSALTLAPANGGGPVCMQMAALQHFRLAEVTVAEENVVVHHSFEKEPGPLPIHFVPICISFALFQEVP